MSYGQPLPPEDGFPRSKTSLFVILAAVAFGILVIVGFVALGGYLIYRELTPDVVLENESIEDKYRETADAFGGGERLESRTDGDVQTPQRQASARRDGKLSPREEKALIAELEPFFEKLGEAFQRKRATEIDSLLDGERYFETVRAQGVFDRFGRSEVRDIRRRILDELPKSLAQNSDMLAWSRSEVHRLRRLGGSNMFLAYLRVWDADDLSSKYRWWVVQESGRWRFYDYEELATGLRGTTLSGIGVRTALAGGGTQLELAMNHIRSANVALAQEDYEAARDAVENIGSVQLPGPIEALRWMQTSLLQINDRQFEDALDALNKTEAHNRDMPMVPFLRSIAFAGLGQYDDALTNIEAFHELLGEDADTLFILASTLKGLDRLDEAADAYRRGLDDNPDSLDNLVELAILLPSGEKDELTTHYRKLRDPGVAIGAVCEALLAAGDLESVALLATLHRELLPDDPNGDYYDALVKYRQGLFEESARASYPVIARVQDANERAFFVNLYLDAMVAAGKPLEGYRSAPDASEAFAYVAQYLVTPEESQRLSELVEAHRPHAEGDPLLDFYEGESHTLAERYAEADRCYLKGMQKTLSDDLREAFRASRVYARHAAGDWVNAYREIGPRRATFGQLAALHTTHDQTDALESLVTAHGKDDPADSQLLRWRVEVDWARRRFAAVVDRLRANRAQLLADPYLVGWYEHYLIYSLVYLERADEATSIAISSTERDGDPWFLVVVHAAKANLAELSEAMRQATELGYTIESFYEDPIVGPALHRPRFAELRETYPPPVVRPPL